MITCSHPGSGEIIERLLNVSKGALLREERMTEGVALQRAAAADEARRSAGDAGSGLHL